MLAVKPLAPIERDACMQLADRMAALDEQMRTLEEMRPDIERELPALRASAAALQTDEARYALDTMLLIEAQTEWTLMEARRAAHATTSAYIAFCLP